MNFFLSAAPAAGGAFSLFLTMGIMLAMLYFMIYRPQIGRAHV